MSSKLRREDYEVGFVVALARPPARRTFLSLEPGGFSLTPPHALGQSCLRLSSTRGETKCASPTSHNKEMLGEPLDPSILTGEGHDDAEVINL